MTTYTDLAFTPSTDHDAVWTDGQALLARYELTVTTQAGAAVLTKDIGKPTPTAGVIALTVPELASLPADTYTATVAAIGPGGAAPSLVSPPWTVAPDPTPIPPPAPPTDVRVQAHTEPPARFAHTVTAPGWATWCQDLPAGYARGFTLGDLDTQIDVKNRWPDGTIRKAIATAKIDAPGTYPIRVTAEALRDVIHERDVFLALTPTPHTTFRRPVILTAGPRVEDLRFEFDIDGAFWTATLPPEPSADVWLDGAHVHERREVLVPVDDDGTPHPLIQIVLDVRDYRDGGSRFDVAVQNCRNVAAMDLVSFDLMIWFRGALLWAVANVDLYLGNRYRRTLPVNGLAEAAITLDMRPVHAAGAFPAFLRSMTGPTYAPLDPNVWGTSGNMMPYMMNGGGRPEIGYRVWWDAQHATHPSPELRATCIGNGNCSGFWTFAICEPDGLTPMRLDRHPGFWFDGRGVVDLNIGRQPSGALMGQRPEYDPDAQHVPAVNYYPYLLTGDRWHVDQMRHWANWAIVKTYPGDSRLNGIDFGRDPLEGPFVGQQGFLAQNGLRGFAWTLRLVIDAAVALPDGDPDKAYFHGNVAQQLTWCDAYARNELRNPALPPLDPVAANGGITEAIFWERADGVPEPPYTQDTIWQSAYVAGVIHQAMDHGDWGVLGQVFRDRAIRFQTKYATSDAEGYGFEYAFGYYPRYGKYTGENQGRSAIEQFPDMKALWDHDFNPDVVIPPNPVKAAQPIVGYYGVEGYLLLAMGVAAGNAACAAPLARLLQVPGMVGDLHYRAGFAVDFARRAR